MPESVSTASSRQGLLALTHDLAYDEAVRSMWLAPGSYEAMLKDYGITDPHVRTLLLSINNQLGTLDASLRKRLVREWMDEVAADVMNRTINPRILW